MRQKAVEKPQVPAWTTLRVVHFPTAPAATGDNYLNRVKINQVATGKNNCRLPAKIVDADHEILPRWGRGAQKEPLRIVGWFLAFRYGPRSSPP